MIAALFSFWWVQLTTIVGSILILAMLWEAMCLVSKAWSTAVEGILVSLIDVAASVFMPLCH